MYQQSGSEPPKDTNPQDAASPLRPADPAADGLTPGDRLRLARESRSMTLEDASRRSGLHLRPDLLRAFEDQNLEVLPPFAMGHGMLRSYADYLGLDADALVRQWREEVQPPYVQEMVAPRRATPLTPIIGAAAAILASVLLIAFVIWPRLTAPQTEATTSTGAMPSTPAVAELEKLSTPGLRRAVVVTALRAGWFEARGSDGAVYIARRLAPGETYEPEVGAGWTIFAEDGGFFTVAVDGKPMGLLGEAGQRVLGKRVDEIPPAPVLPQVAVTPQP
jgi:hypothetical protein